MVRDNQGDQRNGSLTSLSDRFRSRSGNRPQDESMQHFGSSDPQTDEPGIAPQPASQSSVRPSEHRPTDASVIDAHSTFDGRFQTAQDLRIEGTVSGEIICRGALYVEREAVARVKKVEAREVYVFGTLEGEIECSEKLVLAETGNISGNIRSGSLVVYEGGILNGTVETGEGIGTGEGSPSRRTSRRGQRAESTSTDDEKAKAPSFSLSTVGAVGEEEAADSEG